MATIDDELGLSSDAPDKQLEQNIEIAHDKNENGSYYLGQLNHKPNSDKGYDNSSFKSMIISAIEGDLWFIKSTENVVFLQNNFTTIIDELCTDIEISRYISSPVQTRTLSDQDLYYLFHKACYYLLDHCKYGKKGEKLIDYINNEDVDLFIRKLALLSFTQAKLYLSTHDNNLDE